MLSSWKSGALVKKTNSITYAELKINLLFVFFSLIISRERLDLWANCRESLNNNGNFKKVTKEICFLTEVKVYARGGASLSVSPPHPSIAGH